jgi:hypothetical protein
VTRQPARARTRCIGAPAPTTRGPFHAGAPPSAQRTGAPIRRYQHMSGRCCAARCRPRGILPTKFESRSRLPLCRGRNHGSGARVTPNHTWGRMGRCSRLSHVRIRLLLSKSRLLRFRIPTAFQRVCGNVRSAASVRAATASWWRIPPPMGRWRPSEDTGTAVDRAPSPRSPCARCDARRDLILSTNSRRDAAPRHPIVRTGATRTETPAHSRNRSGRGTWPGRQRQVRGHGAPRARHPPQTLKRGRDSHRPGIPRYPGGPSARPSRSAGPDSAGFTCARAGVRALARRASCPVRGHCSHPSDRRAMAHALHRRCAWQPN